MLTAGAWSQTKWDLASEYPATNFHTENLVQFADDVVRATGGQLKITVHANASLFKASEIMLQDWQKKAGPEGESIVQAYLKMPSYDADNAGTTPAAAKPPVGKSAAASK